MKKFNQTLDEVQRIKKGFKGKSIGISVNILKNTCKGFDFEFKQKGYHPLEEHAAVDVAIKTQTLGDVKLENLVVTEKTFGKFSGIAAQFSSANFSESQKMYYRQVLVLPKKLDFAHYIQDEVYQTSPTSFHRGCLSIFIGESKLEVFAFQLRTMETPYIIIDSVAQLDFEAFSQRAYRVLIALGFIVGKFYQNEGYYFGFENKEMETAFFWRYLQLRDSKNVFYYPVYGNAHGVIHQDKEQANKFQLIIKPMSLQTFTNICERLYQKPDFQALMVLFLEACSSSLLLMPAGLSVVLEGLRTILMEENETKITYLDRKLAKDIKNEMRAVLNKFNSMLSEEGLSVLKKKINDFDKPTNQSQLIKPFELYQIHLKKSDKDVLNNRNHFLHGRISLGFYEKGQDQKAGEEMHYNALKLYTLVSSLILKYIGYKGWIINHVKVHELNIGRIIDEEYFIEI